MQDISSILTTSHTGVESGIAKCRQHLSLQLKQSKFPTALYVHRDALVSQNIPGVLLGKFLQQLGRAEYMLQSSCSSRYGHCIMLSSSVLLIQAPMFLLRHIHLCGIELLLAPTPLLNLLILRNRHLDTSIPCR